MSLITEKLVLHEDLIMEGVTVSDILAEIEKRIAHLRVIMIWAIEDNEESVISIRYPAGLTIEHVIEEVSHATGHVYIRTERVDNNHKIFLYASFLKKAHGEQEVFFMPK